MADRAPRAAATVATWPGTGVALRAVLFDVDFTVLRPNALFSAAGYAATGARFGLSLDQGRWEAAQRQAYAAVKARRAGRGNAHDDAVYEVIAGAIVAAMGGGEPGLVARCAAAIVDQWGRCQNFSLYRDVKPCLERLRAADLAVGLVSNTNRDLGEVIETFALGDLVAGAVTSAEVGLFKPAPEIFAAALDMVGAAAAETVMIGDSYSDDVEGARAAGLGAVLLDRDGQRAVGGRAQGPIIDSLGELPGLFGLA